MVVASVAVVRVTIDHFRPGWGAAVVDRCTAGDFDLDGGVVDAEMIAQLMVDALQQGFAFAEVHLADLQVAG